MAAHNSSATKIQQNKLRIDAQQAAVKTLTSQLMRAKTVTTHTESYLEHVNMSVVNNTTGSTTRKK